MANKKFIPGRFVRLRLSKNCFGYGRLREDGNISFYDFYTVEPSDDLSKIAQNPILFTVCVHDSALNKWEVIGDKPLEEHLKQPFLQFWQDVGDIKNCRIFDMEGNERQVTPAECEGLERWAVWEAPHVESRLIDSLQGRANKYAESMKVRYAS